MSEFYNLLSQTELVFFWIGVISGIIFIIQLALSLIGGGMDTDFDYSSDGLLDDGILTFKNLINFLTIFGWLGLSTFQYKNELFLSIVIGSIGGILMVGVMTFLLYFFHNMKHDGTLKMTNCVGKIGTVYLLIPKNSSGKINITVQGAEREFEAVGKDGIEIPTGTAIKVIAYSGDRLMVEKI